jgi:lysozyme
MTDEGVAMVKLFERFRARRYRDQGGKWTIGWGHLIKEGETFTEPMSLEDGEELLRADIDVHEREMLSRITVPLQEHEQDALTSLVFNIGGENWRTSTILKRVNAGHARGAIANEFTQWIKVRDKKTGKKVVSRGLVRRRNAEAARYLGAWVALVSSIYTGECP